MTPLSDNQDSIYLDATGHSWITSRPTKATAHLVNKWGLAATDMCPCGKRQTMSHIVNSCPQSKLEGAAAIALSWWRCYWMAEDIWPTNALDNNNNAEYGSYKPACVTPSKHTHEAQPTNTTVWCDSTVCDSMLLMLVLCRGLTHYEMHTHYQLSLHHTSHKTPLKNCKIPPFLHPFD